MRMSSTWAVLPLVAVVFAATLAEAAPTPLQRRQLGLINNHLKKANLLLDNGKTAEAAAAFNESQENLAKVLGEKPDADLLKLAEPVLTQLKQLHGLLELEGVKVPALATFTADPAAPAEPGAPGAPTGDVVSFSKEIAPLLVGRCGRCHVNEARGKVSMTNFAALLQGHPEAGPIILPGNSKGSRIIEVIESGDMPRGGGRVGGEQLALLAKWIDQGAKNDLPNATTPLSQLAAANTRSTPALPVVMATGKESVKFGLDVASVLVNQCSDCHGERQPRGGLSFANFSRFLRGGDSGPVLTPGKGADSLLVKKLKGQAGDRMPLRRPALSAEVIAKIETWIDEGAKFDGGDAALPLTRVAAVARARTLTAEQLSEERQGQAERNWRLANPDDTPARLTTDHFIVLGTLGEGALAEMGETAEAQVAKVAAVLKAPQNAPLIKGRVSLFVMGNRFDYSEYGTMVEKRELPRAWRGHWRFDLLDPYIVVLRQPSEPYSMDVLFAQQIASLYVASLGEGAAPRWFAEGIGRAVAAKMEPGDPRVKAWDEQISGLLAQMRAPDDFLQGKLPPEETDILSYSFVQFLMSDSARLTKLLKWLDEGMPFEQALGGAYGRPAAALAAVWAPRAARKR